jgi:hypothetical protein
VSWYGTDATDTDKCNIKHAKSVDGTTWTKQDGTAGVDKLTTGNLYAQKHSSIGADKNNNIYIVWWGIDGTISTTWENIRKIVWNGTAWSSITLLTSQNTTSIGNPSVCANYFDYTDPICIYTDLQANAVRFRGMFSTPVLTLSTGLQNSYINPFVFRSSSTGQSYPVTTYTLNNGGTFDRTTTPTTVVGSVSYNSQGNSGRKLVRLSNGWLIAGLWDPGSYYIRYYVSKDSANTWSQLCYTNIISGGTVSFSLASFGTKVYAIEVGSSSPAVYVCTFDATTVTNTNVSQTSYADTAQTTFGTGCSIDSDSNGILHATWCCKNSTYPNSFNIRYSKSVDGGISWSAPTQITTANTSGTDCSYPNITIRNNTPYINYLAVSSTNYIIYCQYYNGASWSQSIVCNSTSAQWGPSSVVAPDGSIHVTWSGNDASHTNGTIVYYSKSTDGGVTWPTLYTLYIDGGGSNQTTPMIAADKNNNIYVVWYALVTSVSSSYTNMRKIVCTGGVWGSVTTVTNNTTGSIQFPSICSNYTNFTDPLCVYLDNQAGGVKFRGVYTDIGTTTITTPVNVINSAYSTVGNGGRKIVRLSNGWLVGCAYNSSNATLYLYVSKDSGATWSQLCYISSSGTSMNSWAICSFGTRVTVLVAYSATYVQSTTFDATTVSNAQVTTGISNVDTAQTSIGSGCSIEADGNGVLHAAWCSKNSYYANSFNIRYSKSTDGGATWATPTQITTQNSSGRWSQNPCLVIKNNVPMILVETYDGSYYIANYMCSSGSWSGMSYNFGSSAYAQYFPSAVVSPDGYIHVTWEGQDATDTTRVNIHHAKSIDGMTWTKQDGTAGNDKLTSGNTYTEARGSITADQNNNIYIMFYGLDANVSTTYAQIRRIVATGTTWGSVTTLTNTTSGDSLNPSACSNYTNFTDPICIYLDNQAVAVKFRGTFVTGTVTSTIVNTPFIKSVYRMNITPYNSVSQIAAFVTKTDLTGYNVTGAASIVGPVQAESYMDLTATSTDLGSTAEVALIGTSPTPNTKVTLKVMAQKANPNDSVSITKIIGGIA